MVISLTRSARETNLFLIISHRFGFMGWVSLGHFTLRLGRNNVFVSMLPRVKDHPLSRKGTDKGKTAAQRLDRLDTKKLGEQKTYAMFFV